MSATDDWIQASDAPARVGRDRRTIYRWIAEGHIRTLRPGNVLWLNLSDLIKTESRKIRRVRGESH